MLKCCNTLIFLTYFLCFSNTALSSQGLIKKNVLKNHKILVVSTSLGITGLATYQINFCKILHDAGYNVAMLVKADKYKNTSGLAFPIHVYNQPDNAKPLNQYTLSQYLLTLCKKEHIDIISCHIPLEIQAAKLVARQIPIKVIATVHSENILWSNILKNVDAVVTVSKSTADDLEEKNSSQPLNIKAIKWIPPFFNENKFLNFCPHYTKEAFYRKNFSITLQGLPIICMIGNFYQNTKWKNHTCLLHAIHKLIYTHHRPVEVMLAGTGPRFDEMRKLAKSLHLEECVHFLGFTDKTPELLFHSDIKVLTGSEEAFGIALLEAALMKKPLIGTRGTGMELIIKDEVTGLLFDKDNSDHLALQIMALLDNPHKAQAVGVNAFNFVEQEFSNKANLEKLVQFYENIL